jgi:hypothetical protein
VEALERVHAALVRLRARRASAAPLLRREDRRAGGGRAALRDGAGDPEAFLEDDLRLDERLVADAKKEPGPLAFTLTPETSEDGSPLRFPRIAVPIASVRTTSSRASPAFRTTSTGVDVLPRELAVVV